MSLGKGDLKRAANRSIDDVLEQTEALKEHIDEEKFDRLEQIEKFIDTLKEAIVALSLGDLELSQDMIKKLTYLASSKLFKDIGKVTRELHESIKEIQDIIDPSLRDIAQREMKDLSTRLSYASELVKDASEKTLDLLFARQDVVTSAQAVHDEIIRLIDAGDKDTAKAKLAELKVHNKELIDDFIKISELQIHADLVDQLIKKISKVIDNLEDKLVVLLKRFGEDVMEEKVIEKKGELYGPAPCTAKGVAGSQDDVDDLLASLGV